MHHELLTHLIKNSTCKSLSEALIFTSTNPQYNERLSIELRVQYMKIAILEHASEKDLPVYKSVILREFT